MRQYLREMGSVNLLSRNEEISIARKIERGEKKVIKALSKTNIVLNLVIKLGQDVLEGHKNIDEVIEVSEDIYDESKKQELRDNFLRQFEELNRLKREFKIPEEVEVLQFRPRQEAGRDHPPDPGHVHPLRAPARVHQEDHAI